MKILLTSLHTDYTEKGREKQKRIQRRVVEKMNESPDQQGDYNESLFKELNIPVPDEYKDKSKNVSLIEFDEEFIEGVDFNIGQYSIILDSDDLYIIEETQDKTTYVKTYQGDEIYLREGIKEIMQLITQQ